MTVQISLTFVSIEDAIGALAKMRYETTPPVGTLTIKSGEPTAKPPKLAKEPAAPAPTPPTVEEPPAPAVPKTQPTPSATDYKAVSALITKSVVTDRAAVVSTLKEFGANSGKDLKQDQYDAFITKLTAALEAPALD